ncbi:MAG TPA: hypothetical protein VFR81_00865 [Longimicrobium sp.]|nr:hypothetical protein [Longimicrobium sp.]
MKLLRLILTALAVTTLATACGSSTITGPDAPPRHESVMGSGG